MKDFKISPKIQEIIKVASINLLFLFIFLELGSLGIYFAKNKQLFYTREKSKENLDLGIDLEGVRLNQSIVERLHPFFGFIQKPGPDFRPGFKTNNYGFISPYDYPFVKTKENQFIIGIFGGSVASNMSIYEIQNQVISKILKRNPRLKDKEFIILSFATGGYKQPQQVLILNYFLSLGQIFDMVINIDGFNEVALSSLNNLARIDLMMPSVQHIQPLTSIASNDLSPEALKAMLRIQENKTRIKNSLEDLQNCQLALCHAATSFQIKRLVDSYRRDISRFERERKKKSQSTDESVIYFNTNGRVLEDTVAFDKMAGNWVRSSLTMQRVLSANKIPYFHFLQPNQYYQTQRIFGDEEKKIAFNNQSPYVKAVKLGYPALFKTFHKLEKNNVNFFNGIKIFDDTKEIVYVDTCCHYNAKGENIFASYIGRSILETLDRSKEPSQATENRKK